MGLKVVRDDYGNVIANDGGEDPLILSAHMDTVEPGRGVQPSIDGERIVFGRHDYIGGRLQGGCGGHYGSIRVHL